jgi:tripartite-type tricarboxylate transporter receptor subunit TctC
MQRRQFLQAFAAAPWLVATMARAAEPKSDYPSRYIRLVVPYGAGGTADVSCRIVARYLGERLKQNIVIENKPGAGGILGALSVLSAPADGYTFVLAATGNFGISPVLMRSMPFDAVKSFDMVAQMASFSYAFVTAKNSPFKHISELIEYARANPGKLNVGTVQVGSAQYFAAQLFKSMAGISVEIVPFRTSGDVVTAVMTDNVQLAIETLAPLISQVQNGDLRMLGISDDTAFPSLPEGLPITSNGLPGYVVKAWNGLAARAGTPPDILKRWAKEMSEVMAITEIKRRYIDLGIVAEYGDGRKLSALQLADIDKWGSVMKTAGIEKQ